ncbi:MAG TPA: dihydrolipoyl dehydrogenase [Candidatus Polarisedimenticolia bacterium]|nr:dihydrolipoyl dehydrogenase [Candidatus Polarisedimenticolia bacterium]
MAEPQSYDVTVIGSGPGGYVAAIRAAQCGLKTALVEKSPLLGGTCLHVGCIPTKALLHSAEVLETAKDAARFGVSTGKVELDLAAVHKYRLDVVRRQARGVEYLMKKNGITVLTGHGRLKGPGKVEVTPESGGATVVNSKNVILAAGSAVKLIPGIEPDGKRIITSTEALALETVPKTMIVLGAGAVGVEFASIYARFGTSVTVVEMLPRVLPVEDEEISAEMQKALKKRGIEVRVGTKVEKVTRNERGVEVTVAGAKGSEMLKAEILLSAVGRRPVTDDLGLQTVKIQTDRGFVKVDAMMQTTERGIYAIGDIVPTPMLAHLASHEGIVAAEAIAGRHPHPVNYDQVPNATYSDPEVASVGLTEAQAKERGYKVKVGKFPFPPLGKGRILNTQEGFVKLVAEEKYDELLGVHIIGPKATELIAEGVLGLALETTIEELEHTIHAHPTLAEAVGEAAAALHSRGIHL